jgi:L-ribulose-5-phosphate 3-epimerase
MLPFNRRRFFRQSVLGLALAALPTSLRAATAKFKVGVTDWNLRHSARPTSLELAASIGFEGVIISLGRAEDPKNPPAHLPLHDTALQDAFIAAAKSHRCKVASTCLDILHQNYLKNDPLGQKWVAESIPITQRLGARVILLPFFGKGALETKAEMDFVGDFLKEIAPEAAKAGVVLGIEDTISAEDNARILDRAGSRAVQVYYDVGNSQPRGFDIYKEIRWLGRERICEMHLKDNPRLLGEGLIDFPRVIEAMTEIGFSEWAHLETVAPSGNIKGDMEKNLAYIRGLMAKG